MHETEARKNFRSVHRLPSIRMVTYGKNFRCVMAKSRVNKLNWKKNTLAGLVK